MKIAKGLNCVTSWSAYKFIPRRRDVEFIAFESFLSHDIRQGTTKSVPDDAMSKYIQPWHLFHVNQARGRRKSGETRAMLEETGRQPRQTKLSPLGSLEWYFKLLFFFLLFGQNELFKYFKKLFPPKWLQRLSLNDYSSSSIILKNRRKISLIDHFHQTLANR